MRQNLSCIFAAFLISALLATVTSCAPQRHPRTMEQYPYSDPEEMIVNLEIIEINPEETPLSTHATRSLRGTAGELLPELVATLIG